MYGGKNPEEGRAMTVADAGAVTVEELTPAQARDLFERACREELGVSATAFLASYDADELPSEWDVQAVSRVEFLLPFAR